MNSELRKLSELQRQSIIMLQTAEKSISELSREHQKQTEEQKAKYEARCRLFLLYIWHYQKQRKDIFLFFVCKKMEK